MLLVAMAESGVMSGNDFCSCVRASVCAGRNVPFF